MHKLKIHSFILLISAVVFADSPQQWIFINDNFYKTPTREFQVTGQARFIEAEKLSYYQIQPRYAFKLSDWFWGGVNYSLLGVRQPLNKPLVNQHRFEFEVQPRIQISDHWKLLGRERFEYLLNESLEYETHRFRHRTTFQYDGFKDSFANLVTQCEAFFDYKQSKWNQFRTTPLGVRFNVAETGVAILPTIISIHRDDWDHTFAAILELNFDFTDHKAIL